MRILVPIDASDHSRWRVRYAIRRHREGPLLEVILLNVGEAISQWQVLRLYTEQELSRPAHSGDRSGMTHPSLACFAGPLAAACCCLTRDTWFPG